MHLTLKFLGDTPEEKIQPVNELLNKELKDRPAVTSHITGIGSFPENRSPRVIWLGLTDEQNQLAEIAANLEKKFTRFGYKKEKRRFTAHLTLGRVKTPRNIVELKKAIDGYAVDDRSEFTLNQITFYKSTLTPDGPVYEPLSVVMLR